MKTFLNANKENNFFRLTITFIVWGLFIAAVYWIPSVRTEAAPSVDTVLNNMYQRSAPDFDYNLSRNLQNLRQQTGTQLAALDQLKTATNSPNMQVRWNDFGGSPDVIYDFASQSFSGSPEEAGRAFIAQNSGLFGVSDLSDLRLFSQRKALGGNLLRFQQTFNGIPVKDGGIGLVLNKDNQVIMASGPFFRNISVDTNPGISATQAKQFAEGDLGQFQVNLPSEVSDLLAPALGILGEQLGAVQNLQPQLGIYPTADGYKLVWKVAKFSANPFGLYLVSVDAQTGETIERKDFVNFQLPQIPNLPSPGVLPLTADVYPKYPTITDELKDQGIISDCNGIPCGQERVNLRKFHQSNVATGINGTLTGTHALINNALPTKQPFAQAALGTWHFRQDNPTALEARTNEQDQFAEPAEHQDEINAFFFITYLVEYVDYLHVAGDPGTFGSEGSFPDDYPNKTVPLPGTVHLPNFYLALDVAGGNIPDPTDPDFAQKALGMDNAFALNVTSLIESITGTKSPVVVNPTQYGHGFYFNDLALEGTVPYHEGMHAITSPIAGLEGIEGGALNEGQADMWAFTITDNVSLGDYVVNAKGYRDLRRSRGLDPDAVAYIRSAESTLKYSDIATLIQDGAPDFEEHYDGEIYMSTMWDIREMLNRMYPENTTYKRPQPKDGLAQKSISKGTEIFERQFLGSMYILGTVSPDTMVKSRDAMIIADQMLYPSNSADPKSPGKHRALIERIFAAHELGVNALEFSAGRATISTQVTPYAGAQVAPAVPGHVRVAPASARTNQITWDPVGGAVAYEVLRRRQGFENQREPNGIRAYNDGDSSTTGFRHIDYVDGNLTAYEDKGAIHEVFAPEGLDDPFDYDYVVRAIAVASNGQLGFSDFSGTGSPVIARKDVTKAVDAAISNVSFQDGVFAFDNSLTNARGAGGSEKTIYDPIEFKIVSISDPTVSVRNADSGGDTFIYNQSLPLGATSGAKRIEFNDPQSRLFSFKARIYANTYVRSTGGNGSQDDDGTSDPPAPTVNSIFSETRTGTLVGGEPSATTGSSLTWGNPTFRGITWDEVEIVTKDDALSLEATLSSTAAIDLDFELRTVDGQVLSSSGNADANEFVSSAVQPNTTYILRVMGFTNGPADFTIVSNQILPEGSPNENAGTRTSGGDGGLDPYDTNEDSGLVRFTVNPLTGVVTSQLLLP
ncbi:MAG: M36 family metallopeptidase [Pyrinomonadaceae bacterium]